MALSIAATVTYHQIEHGSPGVTDAVQLDALLNRIAHALSAAATIYVPEPQGIRELSPLELIECRFRRGATSVVTRGKEYLGLTMRQPDMLAAIAILRKAGVRFL